MRLKGSILIVGSAVSRASSVPAVEQALAPVLSANPALSLEHLHVEEASSPAVYLPQLLDAAYAVFDLTGADLGVVHWLGVRQALTRAPSIGVSCGPANPIATALDDVIDLNASGADEVLRARLMDAALEGGAQAPIHQGDILSTQYRLSRPTAAPLSQSWVLDRGAGTRIGLRGGDIRAVKDVDVWVNSENTYMEMAAVHARSISGIIRHLGANWRAAHHESDDALRRALAEEMGTRRAVDIGTVLLTKPSRSTQLYKAHNVRLVAHVATVEPVDAARAGSGFVVSEGLRSCMFNLLTALETRNRKPGFSSAKVRRVLVPMLGAGSGGGAVREISQILINATLDYLRDTPDCSLEEIQFLARTDFDVDACRRAITLDPGLKPATGSGG